jgi:predicted transcriptional regulator
MLTGEQMRAARALLRMEQKELSELSEVSLPSIKRLEGISGPITSVRVSTVAAIEKAFEERGIIFLADGETTTGGAGVRLR